MKKKGTLILAAALCLCAMTAGFAHAEDDLEHLQSIWANSPAEQTYRSAEEPGIGWDEDQTGDDAMVTTVRAIKLYEDQNLETKTGDIPTGAKVEVLEVLGASAKIIYDDTVYYVRTSGLW